MPVREPAWWYAARDSLPARLLRPASRLWAAAAARRLERTVPFRSSLAVICVGNFTAGGTGKTPLAMHLAGLLASRGERPAFLSRGYGGRLAGPHRVNPALDLASDVGDEPLLLARHAPVYIARDRAQGAAAIERLSGIGPPTAIVMDDGLQNPGLAKDLVIAVVDGRRGVGNGLVMPAGPLRAPLALQLGMTDAIVINQPRGVPREALQAAAMLREGFDGPVLEAGVEPAEGAAALVGQRVLAVSGIANPARFTTLLAEIGADVAGTVAFPDHHAFTEADARRVLNEATRLDARIVTTEKDFVRLIGLSGARGAMRDQAEVLAVRIEFNERDALRLEALLDAMLARRRDAAVRRVVD